MIASSPFTIERWDANGRPIEVRTGTPLSGAYIVRTFTAGDIEGRSEVLFSGAFSEEHGSGTYVAIDAFEGSILGRTGTCSFWHANTVTRGRSGPDDGVLRIVPDSGTGQLEGIRGRGEIIASGDEHTLVLDVDFEGVDDEFDADEITEIAGEVEGRPSA